MDDDARTLRSGETWHISYSVPVKVDASGAPICPDCEMSMVVSDDGDHWSCPLASRIMDAVEEQLSTTFDKMQIYPDRR